MSSTTLINRFARGVAVVLLGVLAACSEPTNQQSEAVVVVATQSETQSLNAWLDEQYAEQLETSPMTKTRLGDKSDYDELDDFSLAAEERDLEWLRASVAEMESEFTYADLNDDGRLSFDMWRFSLERAEAGVPYRQHGYIFGRGGPHAYLPNFLINFHRVDTVADLEAYVSRLRELDRVFAQLLERARAPAYGLRVSGSPDSVMTSRLRKLSELPPGAPFSNSDSSPNSPALVRPARQNQCLGRRWAP